MVGNYIHFAKLLTNLKRIKRKDLDKLTNISSHKNITIKNEILEFIDNDHNK